LKRPILAVVILLLVALAASVYWLSENLERMVARTIEDVGSELTGTRVSVSSVSLDLSEGRGSVSGLRVGNPRGFSSDDAFRLGNISVEIDPASVTGSPISIREVRIAAPEVLFEVNEIGKANVNELRRALAEPGGSGEGEGGAPDEAGPRIAIGRLVFEAGRIRSDTTVLGGERREVALPSLTMRRLGGSRGATPDELGRKIAAAFATRVVETVARNRLLEEIEETVDEALGEAADAAKSVLRDIFGDAEE